VDGWSHSRNASQLCAIWARIAKLPRKTVRRASALLVALLTRSTLGIAELYLVLAMLFRPSGLALELFDTDESEVVRAHDFIIALLKIETEGVRVTVG
jgi:hypothetical protein